MQVGTSPNVSTGGASCALSALAMPPPATEAMSRPAVVKAERARMAGAARMVVAAPLPHVLEPADARVPQPESTRVSGGQAPGGRGPDEAEELLVGLAKGGEGDALALVVVEGATEAVGLLRTRKDTVIGYASWNTSEPGCVTLKEHCWPTPAVKSSAVSWSGVAQTLGVRDSYTTGSELEALQRSSIGESVSQYEAAMLQVML